MRGRAHVQTHPKGAQMKKKITQLSCPVSIVNKEYSAEDCRREQWVTLLSDVPLCCCCLSLQVVSYHACVCGLFHSYVLYTLCLCPLNCRLSVVFVCAVVCGLIFSLSSFLLCLSCRSIPHGPPPWQTNAQKLQPGKVLPRKTHFLYTINTSICTCIHAQTKLFRH